MENENKLFELRQALQNASTQLQYAQQMLKDLSGEDVEFRPNVHQRADTLAQPSFQGNQQIVEGVFNGQNMVGADGKIYTIPANYASKSKLVEGDILKLTIKSDGSFIYKQIGPVERKRLVGTLVRDDQSGEFTVMIGTRAYKVIMAAITYYKGQSGDEVVILTPEDGESAYAAVENLMHREAGAQAAMELLADGAAAELPMGDAAALLTTPEQTHNLD